MHRLLFSGHRHHSRRAVFAAVITIAILASFYTPPSVSAASGYHTQHVLTSYTTPSSALSSYYFQVPTDDPVPAPTAVGQGRFRYFEETGHYLRGVFFEYWETHGALPVLGAPITAAIVENGLTVQYLERVRLEWHPENNDPRNRVLLTRLGAILNEARGVTFSPQSAGNNAPNSFFFAETGHNLSNAFLSYWLRNGGLAVFGYPISEEIVETNAADGLQYTVQYFERNRFEWHPERRPQFNVQLGLLGVEYARLVNLNPLARVLLPGPVEGGDQDLRNAPRLAELVESELLPVVQALGRTQQFRWIPALLIRNNIRVEFSAIDEEGVAGAFVTTRSRNRPYLILIPERERGDSLEAIGSIIAHEATHGYDIVSGALTPRQGCSVEGEVRAFMNGLAAWILLKGDDALTQRYESGTLNAAVSRSLRAFNSREATLVFDFDVEQGRAFIEDIYGPDCGR